MNKVKLHRTKFSISQNQDICGKLRIYFYATVSLDVLFFKIGGCGPFL